ncbi:3-oxoacyl-reductase [Plectosphaerella cucumerina]|uniref:3-oxoacyl-reductase n=1 Tax=Plectosphaerella cucumerina TaxID=40658 RepID=A0A8K0TKB5_9PEZI|nr:3-oxoacyl-reductase [Plectosphaerella cucumerina]
MPSNPVDNEISGRTALVTGASSGIGAAVARDLWSHGAHLALTYSSNVSGLDNLITSLRAQDPSPTRRISTHKLDLSLDEDLITLATDFAKTHSQPGPDILISNAGVAGLDKKSNPYLDNITVEEFDFTTNVNLRAAFRLCKWAVPFMVERHWGRVVFVSSISAIGGGINGCHYAASKAGLTGMMKNLAYKHAASGVTFNDVAPAMIGDTGMIPDEARVAGTPGDVKNIPVGRLGTPQEAANVVLMFCKTGYMTAQSVLLSGGLK